MLFCVTNGTSCLQSNIENSAKKNELNDPFLFFMDNFAICDITFEEHD